MTWSCSSVETSGGTRLEASASEDNSSLNHWLTYRILPGFILFMALFVSFLDSWSPASQNLIPPCVLSRHSIPGAPATKAEMYLMASSLDADDDHSIDYKEFAQLRRQYRAASGTFQKTADQPPAESPSMTPLQFMRPCSRCEVRIWEPVDEELPRFVYIAFFFNKMPGIPRWARS